MIHSALRHIIKFILYWEGFGMPYVNIRITKEKNVTPEKKRQLIEGATNLLRDVLGKHPKSVHVPIDEVETDNWV